MLKHFFIIICACFFVGRRIYKHVISSYSVPTTRESHRHDPKDDNKYAIKGDQEDDQKDAIKDDQADDQKDTIKDDQKDDQT